MLRHSLLLLGMLLALAGCSSVDHRPAPVEQREVGQGTVAPGRAPQLRQVPAPRPIATPAPARAAEAADAPRVRPLASYRPPTADPVRAEPAPASDAQLIAPSGSNAVVGLMKSADASDDPGRAAAVLERALRIEPNNPFIWHRLAKSRLLQGRFAQAEAVALKSNALAVSDAGLVRANWGIVAEARQALGDFAGAAEAERNRQSGKR